MIFLMRGTSCSGKYTFIERHFKEETAIFSSDKFRMMMTGDIHVQQFNNRVFEVMHNIIDFRLANKAQYTVYNATNLRIRDASSIIELSKKHHSPVTVISIVPPSLEELKKRNNNRRAISGFYVPEEIIEKHYDRYFNCIEPFLEEAHNNTLMKFVEIDQDYGVVNEI